MTIDIFALTSGTSSLRVTSTHPGADSSSANDVASVPVTVTGTAASSAYSTSTHCAIPDADISTLTPGRVDCPLAVADTGLLLTAVENVRIQHTFDADLQLTLVAPDGTSVPLVLNVGQDGDDSEPGPDPCDSTTRYTKFDNAASVPIETGQAPFAGSFRPQGSLLDLARHHQPGIWHLIVQDFAPGDVGSVLCWRLRTTYVPEPAPTVSVWPAPQPKRPCVASRSDSRHPRSGTSPSPTRRSPAPRGAPTTAAGPARRRSPRERRPRPSAFPLTDDDRSEPDEVFGLGLDRPIGAVRGANAVGTIHDGTPVYRARFSIAKPRRSTRPRPTSDSTPTRSASVSDWSSTSTCSISRLDSDRCPRTDQLGTGVVHRALHAGGGREGPRHVARLGLDMTALHVLGARLMQYVWFVSTH